MLDPRVAGQKHICILSTVHSPFDVRIFHKEARSLAAAGYQVTIIAPYSGSKNEDIDGIKVRAISPPRSRRQRMTETVWRVCRAALSERAQVYHFHDPELIPVGILLKLGGNRVVYDVHEDLPRDILDKPWIPERLRDIIAKASRLVELGGSFIFDAVVAATPIIARRFPGEKTCSIQNFPLQDEVIDSGAEKYGDRNPVIVYVGGISADRGAREMVAAMSLVPESLTARFLLIGCFDPPALETDLQNLSGWNRTEFLGWQSRCSVAATLAKSRIGLLLYHPIANHMQAQPNKLFEYMSHRIPVIASDFQHWREIVRGANCGLLVNPLDVRAVSGAIQWLLEHPKEAEAMGRRGGEAVETLYNWRTQAQKLTELYARLIP
jgi:glycosyltransferase involved in cell wall biosynthesis